MSFTLLTAPPTAPDRNDPSTFSARADAYVAWWVTNNTEMNNALTLLNSYSGVTGTLQITDGSLGAASPSYTSDPDTGPYRPSANIYAFQTGGVEAFRISASQNMQFGSPNAITGIGGTPKFSLQGTQIQATIALMATPNNVNGSALALGKSRGVAVDTYTIVQVNDQLGFIEFFGADGTTLIQGAQIYSKVIGSPALGDVRSSVIIATGSGAAGAITDRLTIDATAIAATLPITTTGVITDGVSALGTVAPGALGFGSKGTVTVTPNATGSFTSTVPAAGTKCWLIITTTGASSFTLTFGTGFKTTGTLATGTVAGKVFTMAFVSDGTTLNEIARTVAM